MLIYEIHNYTKKIQIDVMYSPSGLTAANILPYLLQIPFFIYIKRTKPPPFYFLPPSSFLLLPTKENTI